MIDALPKGLRAQFDVAMERDGQGNTWYDRYSMGNENYKNLVSIAKGDDKSAQLFYALMNNDEFLSQGFTSKDTQNFLRSQKGADGQTYFHKFVNWISYLLGLKLRGSAMEEFLGHADKILDNGNYVAAIHNYGERYFTGKGYSLDQARDLTKSATGLLRDAKWSDLHPEAIVNQLGTNVLSDASRKAEAEVGKVFETDPESTMGLLTEGKYAPDISGIDSLTHDLLLGKSDHTVLDLLDPTVADYVYSRARDIHAPLDMLKAATDEANKTLVNVDAEGVREPITGTLDGINKVLERERDFALKTAQVQGLVGIPPAGYMDQIVNNPAPEGLYADPEATPKQNLGWFARWFGTPTSLGKTSKEFGDSGEGAAVVV
jgi:hypothetical protein